MASSLPPTRVIALLDIDSFECQLYKRFYPETTYWDEPWVVADHSGRIVSATHKARELGISREIRLPKARQLADEKGIQLQVFTKAKDREKPDAKETRYGSWEIVDCLKEYVENFIHEGVLECASSDEFYLDLTGEVNLRLNNCCTLPTSLESRTFLETDQAKVNGAHLQDMIENAYNNLEDAEKQTEKKLVLGGLISQEINQYLFNETKFIGSVGVGPNKLLAKMAVSINKPNGITILPERGLRRLANELKIEKIPGFGGNFGISVKEILNIEYVHELARQELDYLQEIFGDEKGIEVFCKSQGICDDPVKPKFMSDGVTCGKTFWGQISSEETLLYHVQQLVEEMQDRLHEEKIRHKREPSSIRVCISYSRAPRSTPDDKVDSWSQVWKYNAFQRRPDFGYVVVKGVMQKRAFDCRKVKVTRIEVKAREFEPVKEVQA